MRVNRLQTEFNIKLQIRHFPLHPETPAEGLSLETLFPGRNIDLEAVQHEMQQRMAQEGLPYGHRTMTFNSRLAQELAKWAEQERGGEAIHNALYQAYFVENINLADINSLVDVATRLGLSGGDARDALNTGRFGDAVDADWDRSRALGITSVPTFVTGNRGLVGAHSYEELVALLESSGATPRTPPASSTGSSQP